MEAGYLFRNASESDEDAIVELSNGKKTHFASLRGLFRTSCTSSLWHVFVAEFKKTKEVVGCVALLVADSGTTIVDILFEFSREHCDQKIVRSFSKHCYSSVLQKHQGVVRRRGCFSVEKLLQSCHRTPNFRVIAETIALKVYCKPAVLDYISRPTDFKRGKTQRLNFEDFLYYYKSSLHSKNVVKEGILQLGAESFNVNQLSSPEYNYLNNQALIFIKTMENATEGKTVGEDTLTCSHSRHPFMSETSTDSGHVLTLLSLKKLRLAKDGISFRLTMYGYHPEWTIRHLEHALKLIFENNMVEPVTLTTIVNEESAESIRQYLKKIESGCDEGDKPLTYCYQNQPCWLIEREKDLRKEILIS